MLQMDPQKAYDIVEWIALETILKELGFPKKNIRWIMLTVTTISYKFSINGEHTKILKAKRGLRQGVPFPPVICDCYGVPTEISAKNQRRA